MNEYKRKEKCQFYFINFLRVFMGVLPNILYQTLIIISRHNKGKEDSMDFKNANDICNFIHLFRRALYISFASIALVIFLYITRKNHRDEYNKNKLSIFGYHLLIIIFDVINLVNESE